MKRTKTAHCVLALALSTSAVIALAQDSGNEAEFAEQLPMAAQSLLLDIVALPDGDFVAVGERGHVVISEDGQTWQQADSVPTRSTLTGISAHGDHLWAGGHDSVIITSGDGGRNWELQNFDPARQQPIMDIHFFDERNGMAIGAYGLALVTTDGGDTWEDSLVNEEEWHNNAILELESALFVAGEAGLSYRSLDGGENWEVIEMPYPGSMFGAVETNEGCLTVFGLRGHAQESCDTGDSWVELDTGTEASIMGGVHVDGETLMVGNSGLVLRIDSAGRSHVQYHSSGVDFSSVVSMGSGRYMLIGEEGVHYWPEVSLEETP